MAVQTWMMHMGPEQCRVRLGQVALGRIGVIVDGRPEIFPVNHVYDAETDCVVFPTNPGTKLHAALTWPWIAFEVDGLDEDGSGWSVLVVGRAEPLPPGDLARVAPRRAARWRTAAVQWVRIVPDRITGRRIEAIDVADRPPPEPDDDWPDA
jgi:nitroimidazol reductase NimA-like FMN-containing flavoprotein (pyridoxamine 5'-phosphate oxidase superfamily)